MTKEFCRHCGAEAPEGAQNCAVCGAPLVGATTAASGATAGGEPSSATDAASGGATPPVAATPAASQPTPPSTGMAPDAPTSTPTGVWAPPGQTPYAPYPTYPTSQAYPPAQAYPAYPPAQAPAYGYAPYGYGGYGTYGGYSAPWPYYAPYYAAGAPVARRAPGETYALVISWIVTGVAGLGILGGLLISAIALISALTGQGDDLSFLGSIVGLALGPIVGGAFGLWYGISGIRRRPSPRFGLPAAGLILVLTILAIGGALALWQFDFTQQRPPGVALGVLPLAALAGMLPALAILAFTTQRLRNPSTRRHVWMSFFYGLTIAPLLALILEGIASLIIVAAFHLTGQDAQSVLGQPNTSNLSPAATIALLLVLSVVAPLVEEGVKPLGAVLAIRRLRTPAEAFLVGLAAGVGFDILETIGYIGQGQADWVTVAIERIGAGLLHGVGAGMAALGWYYLVNGSGVRLRWLRAIGCLVYAVLQHAVFNALALFINILPGGVGEWLNQPLYIGGLPLQRADIIYLGIYLYLLGFLLFMTNRLWRAKGMPERKPPLPAPWPGPYAPYPYPYTPYAYGTYGAYAQPSVVAPNAQPTVGGSR